LSRQHSIQSLSFVLDAVSPVWTIAKTYAPYEKQEQEDMIISKINAPLGVEALILV
jgi:hypothetical protein